jgi:hypothetical protein
MSVGDVEALGRPHRSVFAFGMTNQPNSEDLDQLILSNRKLEAIRVLRQRRGLSLAGATEALMARYRHLRATDPSRFTCEDVEYWRAFHS